jgi:hypothetical protein
MEINMKRDGRRSRRVVVTGMGVIAPTGLTVSELFAAQVAGRSGVSTKPETV